MVIKEGIVTKPGMENQCIAQMIYFQCTKIKLESMSQIEYVRNEINHTVDRPHVPHTYNT